jgi:tRNA (guanine-N7-)-methyltransferase
MTRNFAGQATQLGTLEHRTRMQQRGDALRMHLNRILPIPSQITWELGCGHGHFLTAFAQANPEKICIGIDIISDRIERALRKRDRAQLANLHFIQAEGRFFLESLPIGILASEIFILFPDPWPKVRHHKHRILRPDFLTAAAGRTAPNGKLCFRTDHQPYFDDACRTVSHHPCWTQVRESWPFEFTTVFQNRAPSYQSLIARRNNMSDDA